MTIVQVLISKMACLIWYSLIAPDLILLVIHSQPKTSDDEYLPNLITRDPLSSYEFLFVRQEPRVNRRIREISQDEEAPKSRQRSQLEKNQYSP